MSQPTVQPPGPDAFAPPVQSGAHAAQPRRPGALRSDLLHGLGVAAGTVLVGAPAGLLWSAVSPRVQIRFQAGMDPAIQDVEGKGFFGADGSLLVVCLVAGLLTGLLAWFLARRGGPWTVVGLVVGGLLASQVAAVVGVRPGLDHYFATLAHPPTSGTLDFFLGKLPTAGSRHPELRSSFDASQSGLRHVPLVDRVRFPVPGLAWPLAALAAFLVPAFRRPEELDEVSSG